MRLEGKKAEEDETYGITGEHMDDDDKEEDYKEKSKQ